MSDAVNRRMKVSREGLVLIKSFEGFRQRAEPLGDGRWVIGYGHTASAREGAVVGEQDAELLLQYDLVPVVTALNERVGQPLNQHQFDALASFAVSVGVERFLASDVLSRINAGRPDQAAEALVRWPDFELPDAALRRRTAERALFVANPAEPVRLSDLLSAPLPEVAPEPEPAVIETAVPVSDIQPPFTPVLDTMEPAAEATPADIQPAFPAAVAFEPQVETPAFDDAQPHALAPLVPDFGAFAPTPVSSFPPIAEPDVLDAVQAQVGEDAPGVEAIPVEDASFAEAPVAEATPVQAIPAPVFADPIPAIETARLIEDAPAALIDGELTAEAPGSPAASVIDFHARASQSFSLPVSRELPPFIPITEPEPALPEENQIHFTAAEPETVAHTPVTLAASPPAVDTDAFPSLSIPADVESLTPTDGSDDTAGLSLAPLVLTPPLETDFGPIQQRPVWTQGERGVDEDGDGLPFDEPGLSIVRHEIDPDLPAGGDRVQTASFLVMAAVGLVASGASAAAFRLDATRPDMQNLAVVGWALAIIGVTCVGVSAWNLYVRWGRNN